MAPAVSLSTNLASLSTHRRLRESTAQLSRTFERLSSGLRINRASDDAAGLAVSAQLDVEARVYVAGVRNANDVLSLLSIADGTAEQLGTVLTRLEELAVQIMNGTLSSKQRSALDEELQKLRLEYQRMVGTVAFNGLKLLDGTLQDFSAQVGGSSIDQLSLLLGLSGGDQSVGTGTFQSPIEVDGERRANSVAVGDFNGDATLDAAVAHESIGAVRIYHGDGQGGLTFDQEFFHTSPTTVRSGDLDNDGKLDLVYLFAGRYATSPNNGTSFDAPVLGPAGTVGTDPIGLGLADFNGDNILDMAVQAEASQLLTIWHGNGDGTFSLAQQHNETGGSLQIEDVDRDGLLDIVTVGGSSDARFFRGLAGGTFAAPTTSDLGGYSHTRGPDMLALGDVNGDTYLDLVTRREIGSGRFSVTLLHGDGTGGFGPASDLVTDVGVESVKVTDLDGDGDADILYGDNSDSVQLLLGNGQGSFTASSMYFAQDAGSKPIGVGDFNNDGVPDLFVPSVDGVFGRAAILLQNAAVQSEAEDFTTLPAMTLLTEEGRSAALHDIRRAREAVSGLRGRIGAYESRVATAVSVLGVRFEEARAASSRIRDADVAVEASQLIKSRLGVEIGAAVLAQANQAPALALQLLGGAPASGARRSARNG